MTQITTQIRTPAAQSLELLERIAAGIEQQNAKLAALTDAVTHLLEVSGEAAAVRQAHRPFPEPAEGPAPVGNTVVFMAETLTYGIAEDGKPIYKIKGGQYTKFGVRVWPEALPLLGVNADALKPGPNAFSGAVLAVMGEKGPQKVIGLAN